MGTARGAVRERRWSGLRETAHDERLVDQAYFKTS